MALGMLSVTHIMHATVHDTKPYIFNTQRTPTKYRYVWKYVSLFLAYNSQLRSTICLHHPPQRAVQSQICCFGERKVVLFQILLDGAKPRDAGTT